MKRLSDAVLQDMKKCPLNTRLQRLRWENELTQEALAQQLGCRQSTVSLWECGTYAPSKMTQYKMIQLFGLPEDFFQEEKTIAVTEEKEKKLCV